MELLCWVAFAAVVINFCAFIAASKLFFDTSKTHAGFVAFAATFVTAVLLTCAFQLQYPRADARLQAASALIACASGILFVLTVRTTRSHPFAAIFSQPGSAPLVSHGPYRVVRHPFYSAYLLTFYASALASAHAIPAGCAVVMTAVYFFAARAEENNFLRGESAARYADYCRRTGMFLPWPAFLAPARPKK